MVWFIVVYLMVGFIVGLGETESRNHQRHKENASPLGWKGEWRIIIFVMLFFPFYLYEKWSKKN